MPIADRDADARPAAILRLFALLVLLLCFATGRASAAAADDEDAPVCRCPSGEACYHWLNAPVSAPDADCPCGKCAPRSRHAGNEVPAGWNPDCWKSRDMRCFLKRQATNWRFTCSECLADTTCCKTDHPDMCPQCGPDGKSPWRKDAAQTVAERLAVERKHFDKSRVITIVARHVYLVTDAPGLRIPAEDGMRIPSAHEYAHILAMRAERAWREFNTLVGSPGTSRPVGVFIPKDESSATALKTAYFRHPRAPMIYSSYGSSSTSGISEGFCLNGFCFSIDRMGKDDAAVHQGLRHYLANIFHTNWIVANGETRTTPAWTFEGLAQWFGKRPGGAVADHHIMCCGEKDGPEGANRGWDAKLLAMARSRDFRPADEMVDLVDLDNLTYRDHLQLWGWFREAMTDIRKPWVSMLADIRRQVPVREAFKKHLGWTPAEFHQRFVEKLLGTRKSLLDGPAAAGGAGAGGSPLAGSPGEIASKLRSIGAPEDAAAAQRLLDLTGGASDLVRETAFQMLLRAKKADAVAAVHLHGLVQASPVERAYAARACRLLKIAAARDALRTALADSHWLVRAEAALALATLKDFDSQAKFREMVAADPSPKARIGAIDALRILGKEANPICVPVLAAALSHEAWQVRVATAECLAVVGDIEAVGPLVARLQLEGGRTAEEIRLALKAITYEDLGPSPEAWRSWWEREEARARQSKGFTPPKEPVADGRYAPETPPVFGIENWSSRVGFVLDVSGSTSRRFTPHPELSKRLFGDVRTTTVQKVMQAEIARAIRGLDSRAYLSLWTFSSAVLPWRGGKLERCGRETTDAAIGYLDAQGATGETNIHGALRAVLALEDEDGLSMQFRPTPDTVTIVTDGHATAGEITLPEAIATWYAGLNRYARIRTHTIAIGQLDVDETLLERLAKENDGRFVQVFEFEPK